MRLISSAKSHIGRRRKINQDAFYLDDELGFYVVADGMGGHAAGEVAAREAVEATHDMIAQNRNVIQRFGTDPTAEENARDIRRLMESSIQSATYMVFGIAEQSPDCHGMGTTVSALLIVGDHAVTAQVGDTRVYRVRQGQATQITQDHTLTNWQIQEGIITPEEARFSPHKNVITRAVGNKDYVNVDTQIFSVAPGDRFLLCSDGLHGYLKPEEIPDTLDFGAEHACTAFVELANLRGGKDNITALVVELTE